MELGSAIALLTEDETKEGYLPFMEKKGVYLKPFDPKTTLETSEKDTKTTLETSEKVGAGKIKTKKLSKLEKLHSSAFLNIPKFSLEAIREALTSKDRDFMLLSHQAFVSYVRFEKTTLVSSGEDVKLHSFRVQQM